MKVIFMGGHELGALTLEYLLKMKMNILAVVVTKTDDAWYEGVDNVAIQNEIPLYRETNINSPSFVEIVKTIAPDLIVSVNFSQIFKRDMLIVPVLGTINVHASLLPKYRGRAPLNWAIIKGEKMTGVTVHYVDEGVDTGDIILQEKIEILKNDTIFTILEKVKKIYPHIVYQALSLIENNEVIRKKQPKGGFTCKKRGAQDGKIIWNSEGVDIFNLIRGVSTPYPGAFTYYENSKIIIWRALFIEKRHSNLHYGMIMQIEEGKLSICVKSGTLLINTTDLSKVCDFKVGSYFMEEE